MTGVLLAASDFESGAVTLVLPMVPLVGVLLWYAAALRRRR